MSVQETPPSYPRNKEELIRDFNLAGRLKDIRDSAQLKDVLLPRWWEAVVGLTQFAAAIGFLGALLQHPFLRSDPLARLITFFLGLLILTFVLGFEFMLFRLYHLRRAFYLMLRRLDDLQRDLEHKEKE